jgi:hypothetical protein
LAGKEIRHLNDLDPLLRDLINPFCHHFNIQIHYRHLVKEIYRMVWRMKRGTGYKGEMRMIRKDFFREALCLFRWLAASGQVSPEFVTQWESRAGELNRIVNRKRRRRRRRMPWHMKHP